MAERSPDPGDQNRVPEREGDPYEREREFLEERLAPLRPKRRKKEDAAAGPGEAASAGDKAGPLPPEKTTPPPDSRRSMVDQYRQRQRAQQSARDRKPSPETGPDSASTTERHE
jgi:hypothetical protein